MTTKNNKQKTINRLPHHSLSANVLRGERADRGRILYSVFCILAAPEARA